MKQLFSKVYSGENVRILRSSVKSGGLKALWSILMMKFNQIFEPEHPKTLPAIIHLETTSRCNLRCPSCAHSELLGVGEDMTFETYKKLMDQFDYVGKLILYGIGETIMNRETFKMVEYAKNRGIFCGFFTNGTLLTERVREDIIKYEQDYLNISIDGSTKETFEVQRAGANFEKVMGNIKSFTQLAREKKSNIDIAVWNCLTAENIHELAGLVRLTHELGVEKLTVQDIMFWGSEGIEQNFEKKIIDSPQARRDKYFAEAKAEAKKYGISLDLLMSAGDGKRRCKLPWFFTYVTSTGLATPCNWHGWDGKELNFGNIGERSFKEVWNDPKYVDFRKEMKSKDPIEFCKKCPMWDREMIRLA